MAAITASPNCLAIVLAINLRNTSPATMHTSVRFRQRCHPPHLDNLHHRLWDQTSRENFPRLASMPNRRVKGASAHSSCQKGQLLPLSGKTEDIGGTIQEARAPTGSRGLAGLLLLSVNIERVAFVPGASAAPSRTCRADDNSPNCTNNSALVARSRSPSCGCNTVVASFACCNQLDPISPGKSLKPCNQFASGDGPTANLVEKHPWQHEEQLPPSGLLVASSNANYNALLNGPLRNLGTAFITAARFSNNALGSPHPWNGWQHE